MRYSIFRPIIFGIMIGAALFFTPFFALKVLLFVLIIGAIFRMFSWRRYHWRGQYYTVYADRIRSMSEEEYKAFKEKMNRWNDCCQPYHYRSNNWNDCCHDDDHCGTKPAEKKEENKESNKQNPTI